MISQKKHRYSEKKAPRPRKQENFCGFTCRVTAGGLAALLVLVLPAFAKTKSKPAPPPSVIVAPVRMKNIAPVYTHIGRVIALQSVKVVPRVTGFLDQVAVRQGAYVKAGQVLFRLQSAQYRAALDSAEAGLASAEAALQNASLIYERAARLSRSGFEARANLDTAAATEKQDQSNVLSGKANVIQAGLNLSYCTITSPISGRIGAVALTKGNLVTPSSGALVTVNQLDPIRVVFSVTDGVIVGAKQRTHTSQEQIAEGLAVNLKLSNGRQYQQTGKIAFIDNQVSTQTGTVSVYADFANPQGYLLPGAYLTVEIREVKPKNRLLVPVAAVQTGKKGKFVLVVSSANKVQKQKVTLGSQVGQDYIVKTGVNEKQNVIVEGVQKVKPGQTVNPSNNQA
jgi:membrane fusion protein (multidrug efflux system)